jgi:ElaA protein
MIKVKTYEELTKDELYRMLKARQDVFVVEQNCPYPDIDETDLR